MEKLAADFRFMQLYAHNSHNLVKGKTFFEDHSFLGDLYKTYESAYDSIIERMMGLGLKPDLNKINKISFHTLEAINLSENPEEIFKAILAYEKYICKTIEKMVQDYSEGTKQMLGTLADESEMRQYKLNQRV